MRINKAVFERIYRHYNRREYVSPDPLQFLYRYRALQDREAAGFIAACLAYGSVAQILKAAGFVLDKMGPNPRDYIVNSTPARLKKDFNGFYYRFTRDTQLRALLAALKTVISRHGSLEKCFASHCLPGEDTVFPALQGFIRELYSCGGDLSTLVPSPDGTSALKRLNLWLRWMVRSDNVDPGGWKAVPPSKLVVPLDVHMFRACRSLGFTKRRAAGRDAALEITRAFGRFSPEDPVKYDFCLTRFGIRDGVTPFPALSNPR